MAFGHNQNFKKIIQCCVYALTNVHSVCEARTNFTALTFVHKRNPTYPTLYSCLNLHVYCVAAYAAPFAIQNMICISE